MSEHRTDTQSTTCTADCASWRFSGRIFLVACFNYDVYAPVKLLFAMMLSGSLIQFLFIHLRWPSHRPSAHFHTCVQFLVLIFFYFLSFFRSISVSFVLYVWRTLDIKYHATKNNNHFLSLFSDQFVFLTLWQSSQWWVIKIKVIKLVLQLTRKFANVNYN